MKFLWVSNPGFTRTGYGVATASVLPYLVAEGHKVDVMAFWGLQGGRLELDGIDHYPSSSDQWGNDKINDLATFLKSDIALILRDIWVNDPSQAAAFPTAAWFPVDHAPLGEHLAERMKETRWLATMSRWGVKVCEDAGYQVDFVPHSVDSNIYKYSRDKAGRKLMGIPDDAFLVSIVAANKGFPSRKGYPEMFQAVAEFQKRHPDVWLYTHAIPTSEHGGPDLHKLAQVTGVDTKRYMFLAPFFHYLGMEPEDMARFYSASDVLLNTSYGEGFGITILEAQACGTPVVTTDWSSMPELTYNGTAVEGTKFVTAHYGYWKVPSVGAIVDALEREYRRKGSDYSAQKSRAVAGMIASECSDAAVFERYWTPWLAKMESELALLK